MFTTSVLLCLIVTGAFAASIFEKPDDSDFNKIVGGVVAQKGDFMWVVSLQTRGGNGTSAHFCGGSILNKNYILTAAHCVYGNTASNIQVQHGIIDLQSKANIVFVSSITIHSKYKPSGNFPNDIAILQVETAMKLDNKNSGPVTLPSAPLVISNFTTVQLCGWGYRRTEEAVIQRFLLYTNMPQWSDAVCKKYLGSHYKPAHNVCAGTLDGQHKQCSGDSGGPLTKDGVQYGVVSWSYKPCTIANKPGVFTNVANYLSWIASQTGVFDM